MYRQYVANLGCIDLFMSPKVHQRLMEKKRYQPHLPDPMHIVYQLQLLGSRRGVPATLTRSQNGDDRLQLYVPPCYLQAGPSQRGDGYHIHDINLMSLHEHERIGRGILMLQAPQWRLTYELKQLSHPNHWLMIKAAWQNLDLQKRIDRTRADDAPVEFSPQYENYLNTVNTLIEITRQLEKDKQKFPQLIHYSDFKTAAEKRYERDVYVFILRRPMHVQPRNILCIQGLPQLQGRVLASKGDRMTLKFESSVDHSSIPQQGTFEPVFNETIYRTQRAAVETLREGNSKNKHLLPVLVDNQYQPFTVDHRLMPTTRLNDQQLDAFRRALSIPDFLLILGPPGTGKTRSISEIVLRCSTQQKRVLITSGTHQAVDNVLERLPTTLTAIRYGHEDNVLPSTRHLLAEEQAKKRREQIRQHTTITNSRLSDFLRQKQTFSQWLYHLSLYQRQLLAIESHLASLREQMSQVVHSITLPYQPQLNTLMSTLRQLDSTLQRSRQKMDTWLAKQASYSARSQHNPSGFFFKWLAGFYQLRVTRTRDRLTQQQQDFEQVQQRYTQLHSTLQGILDIDQNYQHLVVQRQKFEAEKTPMLSGATRAIQSLQASIQDLVSAQPIPEPLTSTGIGQRISAFHSSATLLEKRARLLQDWHNDLDSNSDKLRPELLRYADVVGATCIGVATARELAESDFDLVIVDEAGQISLPNLLVPLVRARAAILVGDHQQLPPFVDNSIRPWLERQSPQVLQELNLLEEADMNGILHLLTRSAFELLFTRHPHHEHVVRYIEQHRMPEAIADFVAHHFYEKQLKTCNSDKLASAPHNDPLFKKPLAFVDTSDLPFEERREKKHDASEFWSVPGYSNQKEALLAAHIAAYYEQKKEDWIVIAPYRAQAQLIIKHLRARLETSTLALEDRISTVDSFQGGERSKVIFTFTRSNPHGNVGFLQELRRINVAITRAQHQLVLIGDTSTLLQAQNAPLFRDLFQSLSTYARNNGEMISFKACLHRLPAFSERGLL